MMSNRSRFACTKWMYFWGIGLGMSSNKSEFWVIGKSCRRRGRKKPDGNVSANFETKSVNPSFLHSINKNKGLIHYQ